MNGSGGHGILARRDDPACRFASLLKPLLTWDYDNLATQLATLHKRSKRGQWDAATDIGWSAEVPYGAPIAEDSAGGCYWTP